ncbi:hypothetical protein F3N42_00540 [Marinihelvus fidelis]|uniref:DUF3828 domain-containing protein n=1 Tax=Marinihelvus fidelis TaxID=2613842 RepID=A0A5N0THK8_9GAMM|nr:hypothetical protein [Marinihelvus fidelis]KAA9134071.1 hypothetical protein F3N42_00540 [Marinihelvus fidelis]
MPSPRITIALLFAAFALQTTFNEAHAAPDSTQVISDVANYNQLASSAAFGTGPVGTDAPDSSAIRSSVRKGDTLEYRVTSLYYAKADGEPQREVDSIVSYQLDGGRWVLRDVQTERTRNVAAGKATSADKDC